MQSIFYSILYLAFSQYLFYTLYMYLQRNFPCDLTLKVFFEVPFIESLLNIDVPSTILSAALLVDAKSTSLLLIHM